MRYIGNCIVALVTPWGRLSAVPYAVMAMSVIAGHIAIQYHLTAAGDDLPPYNTWSMGYFGLMWALFCIMSRRFHDAGKTAFFLLPLLVAAFASYLYVFDNLHFAGSDFAEDRDVLTTAEHIRFVVQAATLAALAFATLQPGDFGDNAFGTEFASRKTPAPHKAAAARTTPTPQVGPARVARTLKAAPPQPHPMSEPAPPRHVEPSGPRGRITPSDSSRKRGDGFGRR
jgi:uncharacterized membrane protein YhaH (DUF805 family)